MGIASRSTESNSFAGSRRGGFQDCKLWAGETHAECAERAGCKSEGDASDDQIGSGEQILLDRVSPSQNAPAESATILKVQQRRVQECLTGLSSSAALQLQVIRDKLAVQGQALDMARKWPDPNLVFESLDLFTTLRLDLNFVCPLERSRYGPPAYGAEEQRDGAMSSSILQRLRARDNQLFLSATVLIGILAGLSAVLFTLSIDGCHIGCLACRRPQPAFCWSLPS